MYDDVSGSSLSSFSDTCWGRCVHGCARLCDTKIHWQNQSRRYWISSSEEVINLRAFWRTVENIIEHYWCWPHGPRHLLFWGKKTTKTKLTWVTGPWEQWLVRSAVGPKNLRKRFSCEMGSVIPISAPTIILHPHAECYYISASSAVCEYMLCSYYRTCWTSARSNAVWFIKALTSFVSRER